MDIQKLYDDADCISIENYARKLIGHTFRDICVYGPVFPDLMQVKESQAEYSVSGTNAFSNKNRKGGLGNLLEELYFGYKANSNPEPDFPKAGVELKLSTYEKKKDGTLKAGERLVLTMIPIDKPVEEDLYTSHFWKKNRLLLLIYYLRNRKLDKLDYQIDFVKLFTPLDTDLEIIKQDYKLITDKIRAGKAHELSEGDTIYLGACTKGATAEKSLRPQYYSNILAKRRAFCYKIQYMTYVLNEFLVKDRATFVGKDKTYAKPEVIIKDSSELKKKTFEKIITDKINQYKGMTDRELCDLFGMEYSSNKSQWIVLAYRMLGIKSNVAEEFVKAGITVKAVRIMENGKIKEHSPLPPFRFLELAEEEWEDSVLYEYLCSRKFLYVAFRKKSDGYILKGCQLWNMPYEDILIAESEWTAIRNTVRNGVQFTLKETTKGIIVNNNLPKIKGSKIIHIRPHTQNTYYQFHDGNILGKGKLSDSDLLPDGQRMTKQSFWLNRDYLLGQLDDDLKE